MTRLVDSAMAMLRCRDNAMLRWWTICLESIWNVFDFFKTIITKIILSLVCFTNIHIKTMSTVWWCHEVIIMARLNIESSSSYSRTLVKSLPDRLTIAASHYRNSGPSPSHYCKSRHRHCRIASLSPSTQTSMVRSWFLSPIRIPFKNGWVAERFFS